MLEFYYAISSGSVSYLGDRRAKQLTHWKMDNMVLVQRMCSTKIQNVAMKLYTYFIWKLSLPSVAVHADTVWSREELTSVLSLAATNCNTSPSCPFQEASTIPVRMSRIVR